MRALASLTPLVACLVVSLPAAAQQPRAQGAQAVLTPGDSVRIVVWRKPEFTGDYVVAPDNTITHPLFRAVKVGGVPFATAQANLAAFLSRFEENPQFVMEPLIRVSVSGEVTKPQVFATRPETSIGEAIARAGGTTEEGAVDRVRVLRFGPNGQEDQLRVDLSDPKGTTATLPVRSGDQIVVDRKKSLFKDVLQPALVVIGSIASLGLLIDRVSRRP
jgi:polysaccharide biosynthesis/export protein